MRALAFSPAQARAREPSGTKAAETPVSLQKDGHSQERPENRDHDGQEHLRIVLVHTVPPQRQIRCVEEAKAYLSRVCIPNTGQKVMIATPMIATRSTLSSNPCLKNSPGVNCFDS